MPGSQIREIRCLLESNVNVSYSLNRNDLLCPVQGWFIIMHEHIVVLSLCTGLGPASSYCPLLSPSEVAFQIGLDPAICP